jgi:hypothetical protein
MDLEITPSTYFPLHPESLSTGSTSRSSLLTHANHFVSPAMQGRPDIHDIYLGGSSLFRDRQLYSLLEKRSLTKAKSYGTDVGIAETKKAFGNHAGHPRSLCEHAEKGEQKYGPTTGVTMTVASVICDLKNLEMHVSKGNPCVGIGSV